MRKFRKLLTNPGLFFRDYFNKKYPTTNSELNIAEDVESAIHVVDAIANDMENNFLSNFPIDIVYTWVNDSDESWLKKKNSFLNQQFNTDDSAVNSARFENHNEIYYSIKSVKRNLSWIRNIYIVTDNQKPDWYEEGDNVFIIDHKDIIDHQFLPTFNSHVIEANLHKISGLSENFIYFNDDVMVAKPLPRSHFFRSNGVSSLFVSNKSLMEMQKKGISTPTLDASFNSNLLLKENFNLTFDKPLVHTYVPLKKSVFEEVYLKNFEQISDFLNNKYRGKNDLNMATFLVPWYMYAQGKSVIKTEVCYYFNIRSPHAITQYKKLLNVRDKIECPHSFCVNDFKSNSSNVKNFDQALNGFLTQYYSSF